MMTKENVGISQEVVQLTCPKCGEQHEELLAKVTHRREAVCPKCGFRFEVKV